MDTRDIVGRNASKAVQEMPTWRGNLRDFIMALVELGRLAEARAASYGTEPVRHNCSGRRERRRNRGYLGPAERPARAQRDRFRLVVSPVRSGAPFGLATS